MLEDSLGFVGTGAVLGIGAHVLGETDPTGTAASAQTAIGKLSGFMPVTASVMGAGWVMDELQDLQPNKRKKRKR